MDCQGRDRILDVFVTRDSKDYEGQFDDEYLGSVWSIQFKSDVPSAAGNAYQTAQVVNKPTEWLTWCHNRTIPTNTSGTAYEADYAAVEKEPEMEVGDLFRVGIPATSGYSDYMTVVEKRTFTYLENLVYLPKPDDTVTDWNNPRLTTTLMMTGSFNRTTGADSSGNYYYVLEHASAGTTSPTTTAHANSSNVTPAATNGANAAGTTTYHKALGPRTVTAYRVNFTINVTMPPDVVQTSHLAKSWQDFRAIEGRHLTTVPLEGYGNVPMYPLFRQKRWLTKSGEIACKLDHGVKSLNWIKLVGYSVFNKRSVGFANAHEVIGDDWVALHINEVEGKVISNNKYASGAFAVLHVGSSSDNTSGAIEYHAHDPAGLFCHFFDSHQSTIRNLNLKFLDRNGSAAHFGRMHLWFKLCVSHG